MKSDLKIAIVDYGIGNLYSLIKAFEFFGVKTLVTEDAEELIKADAVILPGVGSFEAGMRGLEVRGLIETIKKVAESGKPMLGICLGAQLMLSKGYEFGVFEGLNLIKGEVVHFPILDNNEKVPHVGWNTVSLNNRDDRTSTILDSWSEGDRFYFVHSYVLKPELEENIFASTEYGEHTFCSIVKKGNMYGCQFHPEKSGKVGLKLINNFINLIKYGKNRNKIRIARRSKVL